MLPYVTRRCEDTAQQSALFHFVLLWLPYAAASNIKIFDCPQPEYEVDHCLHWLQPLAFAALPVTASQTAHMHGICSGPFHQQCQLCRLFGLQRAFEPPGSFLSSLTGTSPGPPHQLRNTSPLQSADRAFFVAQDKHCTQHVVHPTERSST